MFFCLHSVNVITDLAQNYSIKRRALFKDAKCGLIFWYKLIFWRIERKNIRLQIGVYCPTKWFCKKMLVLICRSQPVSPQPLWLVFFYFIYVRGLKLKVTRGPHETQRKVLRTALKSEKKINFEFWEISWYVKKSAK